MSGTLLITSSFNLKLNLFKKLQKQIIKTGGGSYSSQLTEAEARILAITADQMKPLSNPYDDNAIYHGIPHLWAMVPFDLSCTNCIISFTGDVSGKHDDSLVYGNVIVALETSSTELVLQDNSGSSSSIQQEGVGEIDGENSSGVLEPQPQGNSSNLLKPRQDNFEESSQKTKPRRRPCKKKASQSLDSESLKLIYFKKKIELANFQLRSAKIQHGIDMKIKRLKLKQIQSGILKI